MIIFEMRGSAGSAFARRLSSPGQLRWGHMGILRLSGPARAESEFPFIDIPI